MGFNTCKFGGLINYTISLSLLAVIQSNSTDFWVECLFIGNRAEWIIKAIATNIAELDQVMQAFTGLTGPLIYKFPAIFMKGDHREWNFFGILKLF